MADTYTIYVIWRLAGAALSFFITCAIVAIIVTCCKKRRRQPPPGNALAITTISHHNGQAYPMVYQSGAPIPQDPHGQIIPGAAPYMAPPYPNAGDSAPPYPHIGDAATPYHPPPTDNPPSYTVAVRGQQSREAQKSRQSGMEEGRLSKGSTQKGVNPTRSKSQEDRSTKKGQTQKRSRSQEDRSTKKGKNQKRSKREEHRSSQVTKRRY